MCMAIVDREGSQPGEGSGIDEEARWDACAVLGALLGWTATEKRWAKIDKSLDALLDAWVAGDEEAFRDATSDLEVLDPGRAKEAGTTPEVPPPDSTRVRQNETIHRIGKQ